MYRIKRKPRKRGERELLAGSNSFEETALSWKSTMPAAFMANNFLRLSQTRNGLGVPIAMRTIKVTRGMVGEEVVKVNGDRFEQS